MECKFEIEDLKRILYWTVCKFKIDKFHHTTLAGKRDLIGGFFDRWVNRAAEFVVFKNLLRGKRYDVVIDFFFYGQETEKNAPDVIGLQDKSGKLLVKFAEYVDGNWAHFSGTPWIEVKTCRKDQRLIAIKESQMDDEHFYVFVESDVRDDYLTAVLDKSVFSDNILDSFKMRDEFVKSDKNKSLIQPNKIIPSNDLGSFKLIGIFKGSEVKKHCKLCKGGTEQSPADNPRYIDNIQIVEAVREVTSKTLQEGLFSYSFGDAVYLPIQVRLLNANSCVKLAGKKKTWFSALIEGKVALNEYELSDGFYKVNFKTFKRNTTQNEWVGYKSLFEKYALNSQNELLDIFDRLVES
jgi:hypothetical protein